MNKIILDESLRSQLSNLDTEVEVCDEAGQTLGFFLPPAWHHELLYAWAKSQVTDEELEMARRQTGGRPLAEVLADLGKK